MTVRSLFVGLTGLNAMGQGIDVISNNIANVNTVGFRAGRASFDDLFYRTMFAGVGSTDTRGGINPRQLGNGVRTGSIDTIFTQGSSQSTGRLLDMAIQGEGFFVLRNSGGQEFLTRAGNFTLDNEGFIVDPGNGYRLIGRIADENGNLLDTEAPGELAIDFSRKSLAKQTENVTARGNFDSRIGDSSPTHPPTTTSNLLGLFDKGGVPFGLVNGDVIRFETGFMGLGDPPADVESPLNLTNVDTGKGAGVIMTVTESTTLKDLQEALNAFFEKAITDINPGTTSGMEAKYNGSSGAFDFTNVSTNSLAGVRVGVAPRENASNPPEQTNRLVGNFFVNAGDPNLTRTLNVAAESVATTNSIRKADTTQSIDLFDSQGNSHTLTTGLAADTQAPAATEQTLLTKIKDSNGRPLIPSDVIPAKPVFSEPKLDNGTNTAVFTATQVSNIVATQGVYSFLDASGALISIRLSDGALSFQGNEFVEPILPEGTVRPEFADNGLDVTGDSMLNIPSASNTGVGGLMGDQGFTATTTLEDIRRNLEERINAAIRAVADSLEGIDPNTVGIQGFPIAGSRKPDDFPSGLDQPVSITLTEDGSFSISVSHGSLGTVPTGADQEDADALVGEVGEENMGLVFDLAAKTRSVRISTVDPGPSIQDRTDDTVDSNVDADFTDGGGISGFIKSADPFADDITAAFNIGNTDFFDYTVIDGDPSISLADGGPTGIDDSGVHLVALSSGVLPTNDAIADQNFDGDQAFSPEVTAFRALFNKRGYGVAQNFDATPGIDRSSGVPVGVVTSSTDTAGFETNTIHRDGLTRNTVNYQAIVPNDFRNPPTNTTGTILFDTNGRFASYDGSTTAPTITFDPDNGDPAAGGVDPISFRLDLSGITHFSAPHSAQLGTQDGRPVGNLDNVSIAENGEILGIFTNGDTQSLGQILLGTVRNEGGLIQAGDTLFTTAPNSGERIFVEAGLDGGTINSGTLELSNVDLAQEFTNLIVVQRAYQSNTRVITTGDQILQEVIQLKR